MSSCDFVLWIIFLKWITLLYLYFLCVFSRTILSLQNYKYNATVCKSSIHFCDFSSLACTVPAQIIRAKQTNKKGSINKTNSQQANMWIKHHLLQHVGLLKIYIRMKVSQQMSVLQQHCAKHIQGKPKVYLFFGSQRVKRRNFQERGCSKGESKRQNKQRHPLVYILEYWIEIRALENARPKAKLFCRLPPLSQL